MIAASKIKGYLLRNTHPGEILVAGFLTPMQLSQTALARTIGVPPRRINEIVLGRRAITVDTDLRRARYFGMSEGFFIGLQTDYESMERNVQVPRTMYGPPLSPTDFLRTRKQSSKSFLISDFSCYSSCTADLQFSAGKCSQCHEDAI